MTIQANGASPAPASVIEVLVVDDSAVVRQALTSMLSTEPDMRVTAAADGRFALAKMDRARFDVVILDLEMPRMDGLTFLQKVMAERPVPVIVCSAVAGPGTDAAMRALEIGAVDVVSKPSYGVREFLEESAATLVEAVRGAARARLLRVAQPSPMGSSAVRPPRAQPAGPLSTTGADDGAIVAIGASAGGTEAIRHALEQLPADAPGIVAVQHMPAGFTAAFAKSLARVSRMAVKEAEDGDAIARGRVLIAPANRHAAVERSGAGYVVRTFDAPRVSGHRPSVDVLFRSMARVVGSRGIGVLLTGMGADGAEGLLEMRKGGAVTLAQDEETSVVFGMPREAIARGAAQEVVSLWKMAETILKKAHQHEHSSSPPPTG